MGDHHVLPIPSVAARWPAPVRLRCLCRWLWHTYPDGFAASIPNLDAAHSHTRAGDAYDRRPECYRSRGGGDAYRHRFWYSGAADRDRKSEHGGGCRVDGDPDGYGDLHPYNYSNPYRYSDADGYAYIDSHPHSQLQVH